MPTTTVNGLKNFKFPMSPVTVATSGQVGNQTSNVQTVQTYQDHFTNTEEHSAMQTKPQGYNKFRFPINDNDSEQDWGSIPNAIGSTTKIEILGAGGKYEKKVTKPDDH